MGVETCITCFAVVSMHLQLSLYVGHHLKVIRKNLTCLCVFSSLDIQFFPMRSTFTIFSYLYCSSYWFSHVFWRHGLEFRELGDHLAASFSGGPERSDHRLRDQLHQSGHRGHNAVHHHDRHHPHGLQPPPLHHIHHYHSSQHCRGLGAFHISCHRTDTGSW